MAYKFEFDMLLDGVSLLFLAFHQFPLLANRVFQSACLNFVVRSVRRRHPISSVFLTGHHKLAGCVGVLVEALLPDQLPGNVVDLAPPTQFPVV